mmetsp:Transcript_42037/g.119354  ORF Transcript_42037/g.119354 Transcript_42037/m.119354 type:complete len:227 (+) Transcript_42037:588-1268(+)
MLVDGPRELCITLVAADGAQQPPAVVLLELLETTVAEAQVSAGHQDHLKGSVVTHHTRRHDALLPAPLIALLLCFSMFGSLLIKVLLHGLDDGRRQLFLPAQLGSRHSQLALHVFQLNSQQPKVALHLLLTQPLNRHLQSAHVANAAVLQSAAVFEFKPAVGGPQQQLDLVAREALVVADLGFDLLDGVGRVDIDHTGFVRSVVDVLVENLHAWPQTDESLSNAKT